MTRKRGRPETKVLNISRQRNMAVWTLSEYLMMRIEGPSLVCINCLFGCINEPGKIVPTHFWCLRHQSACQAREVPLVQGVGFLENGKKF